MTGAARMVVAHPLEAAIAKPPDSRKVRCLASRTTNRVRWRVARWTRGPEAPGLCEFDGDHLVSDEPSPEELLQASRFAEATRRTFPIVAGIATQHPANDATMFLDSYSNDENLNAWIAEHGDVAPSRDPNRSTSEHGGVARAWPGTSAQSQSDMESTSLNSKPDRA